MYNDIDDTDSDYKEFTKLVKKSEMLQFLDPSIESEFKMCYIISNNTDDYNKIHKLQHLFNPSIRIATMADSFGDTADLVETRLANSNLSCYAVLGSQLKHIKDYDKYRGVAINCKGKFIVVGSEPRKHIGDFCKVIQYDDSVNEFVTKTSETKLKQIGKLRVYKKMRE
jgi:hypothetical protein